MVSVTTALDWCVVGNGATLCAPLPIATQTIGFNKLLGKSFDIILYNHADKGQSKTIGLKTSYAFETGLPLFTQTANELENTLGCWPSLGLVAIVTGLKCNKRLAVRQMDLLPSIARSASLPANKPIAACYHNWLAERRYAFSLLQELDWPEYWLASNHIGVPYDMKIGNNLRELAALQTLEKARAKQRIDELYSLPISHWCAAVAACEAHDILACDSLFMLSRTSHQTPNWWLYDLDYSIKMDAIRTQLARAQEQYLFGLSSVC